MIVHNFFVHKELLYIQMLPSEIVNPTINLLYLGGGGGGWGGLEAQAKPHKKTSAKHMSLIIIIISNTPPGGAVYLQTIDI